MNRRAFLASAGSGLPTALAGCLGGSESGDGDGSGRSTTPTETPDDGTPTSGDGTPTPDDGTSTSDGRGGTVVEEDPRVDEPPYRIERPDPPDDPSDPEDWNELYLCENMPAEPSLPFEQLPGARVAEQALSLEHGEHSDAYHVRVLATEEARDDALDLSASDARTRERLSALDFEEHALLVVESGYGSGSIEHRWKRLEDVDDGIHLYGCYTQPYVYTDDITSRSSVVLIEYPADAVELARISLTVDEDRRVHVNSTEGIVTL